MRRDSSGGVAEARLYKTERFSSSGPRLVSAYALSSNFSEQSLHKLQPPLLNSNIHIYIYTLPQINMEVEKGPL